MKHDLNDIATGLERLSSMLVVFGTYASNYKCENEEAVVSSHIMQNAYEMIADYADMLGEQLEDIMRTETTGGEMA